MVPYKIFAGIQGDESSHRFADTWDSVYTADSLTRVPWYVIAGNHDYKVSYIGKPVLAGIFINLGLILGI
jgi:hypothetical protein